VGVLIDLAAAGQWAQVLLLSALKRANHPQPGDCGCPFVLGVLQHVE
jgi:hypothetical protein